MTQPETLTDSLGVLFVIALDTGYTIMDRNTNEVKAVVKEPYTNCVATNMQRAMIRAHEIIEAEEKAKESADE